MCSLSPVFPPPVRLYYNMPARNCQYFSEKIFLENFSKMVDKQKNRMYNKVTKEVKEKTEKPERLIL